MPNDERTPTRPAHGAGRLVDDPLWARRGRILLSLLAVWGPPLLLSGVAAHELLYNGWGWPIWVLAGLAIWPLVLRRRYPLVVFVACLVFAGALALVSIASLADFALLVALYSVAAHRRFVVAVIATVVLEVGVIVVAIRFGPTGSADDEAAFLTGLTAAAQFLGTSVRNNRLYLSSLEDRATRLEVQRIQRDAIATAAERTRIAREMHDIVAHSLSVMVTLAEGSAATVASDPARASTTMQQVATTGRESLTEMRRLFDVLRSDPVPDRAPQPRIVDLDAVVERVRATGLDVRTKLSGDIGRLGSATESTVFRIVQEALTNVVKHAPTAHRATVTITVAPDAVEFSVVNDGGAPTGEPSSGNGLVGMRERVAVFDGDLSSGPTDDGWAVRGRLSQAR